MTDTAADVTAGFGPAGAAGGRRSFMTLVRVETRKLFDTRTSKILTAVLVALGLGSVAARGLVAGPHFFTLAGTSAIAFGTLLPVLAILTMTGEWSHRTALTTFALEPRRGRVLAAKCLPPLVAAVAACLLALLAAAPVTAAVSAAQGVPAVWQVAPHTVLGWIATMVILTAEGLAMGALLLNAPAAIVIYFVMPMLWSAVGQLGHVGAALAGWLDLNSTTSALTSGEVSGGDLARLAVSALVWIAIPMAAGVLRVSRKDI
ncbi:hypothetical protein [Nonomuraea sp. NPDC050786]|uniref:hypothetical protein n=1 Tax=Nonomuraea sp. NPDC050786 TaxID=3154840 RepID=UPI0033DB4B2D